MEYVEGVTSISTCARPPHVGLACDFMRQAALGLQHAHDSGW